MTDLPQTIYLADYQPFTHIVDQVDLTFRLDPQATRVLTRLTLSPNPARPGRHDLVLHGEGLRLISLHAGRRCGCGDAGCGRADHPCRFGAGPPVHP